MILQIFDKGKWTALLLLVSCFYSACALSEDIIVSVPENFPPHYSVDNNGLPTGFAIDVFNEIANIAEISFKYRAYPNWNEVFNAVKSGEADVIPNLGINQERKQWADFTKSVETFPIVLIVRKDSEYKLISDLKGKSIAVVKDNIGAKIMEGENDFILTQYDSPNDALLSLLSGEVDGWVYPKSVAESIAYRSGLENRINFAEKPLKEIYRAIAVKKGNVDLLEKLNAATNSFIWTDAYKNIFNKWHGSPKPFWTTQIVLYLVGTIISIFIFLYWLGYTRTLKDSNVNLENQVQLRTQEINKAQKEEAAARSMLQYVLDNIPVAVFWKDRNLSYLGCNKRFATDAGLENPNEIIGKTDYQMVWKDRADLYRTDDSSVMEMDKAKLAYEEPQTSNHGLIWLQTSKIPMHDDNNDVIGLLGVYEDITKRKEHENELAEAKESAQQANQAKSQFIANMSHELRTPMHSISSFANLAIKRSDDEKQLRYLQNIRTSSIRLTGLLNDLLDLSKLESGKMEAEFIEQDLTTLIQQSASEVNSLAQDKNITISINTEENFECMIDHGLITQVIVNIFSNAIKFSPNNSVIDVNLETNKNQFCDNSSQQLIKIRVIDEGVGIPPDEIDQVFDKFVQSSKTKSNSGGTGLGLPISKEIIELHKGKIWVESPPDGREKGSAFIMELPVLQGLENRLTFDNVQDAINAHLEWRKDIEKICENKDFSNEVNVSNVSNHHLCPLGQWIDSGELEYDDLDTMKKVHEEFHLLAAECVAFCKIGDIRNETKKRDEFLSASDGVIEILRSWASQK